MWYDRAKGMLIWLWIPVDHQCYFPICYQIFDWKAYMAWVHENELTAQVELYKTVLRKAGVPLRALGE